jgi:general secretion pathway protein A
MFKAFFGLRENPFNVNPDPRFLYLTPQLQEALDQLTYGIQSRKGFILLTGEVGTGKTTLINYLLDWLRQQKMSTAFIFNSHLTVNQLFDFILADFGIPSDFGLKSNMLLRLDKWLIERFRAGESPVLIVDEAQGLSLELLEEIRLLLNLETASEKLLQIVLVGQPELEDKIKRPELRQLRQRIALRCNTAPLTLEESYGYIGDRLRIAGATGEPIFTSEAMEAVHYYSRGIPRVMNLLCEHALINAYVEQLNPVPARMVQEAARDFLLDESRAIPSFSSHMSSNLTVMQSIFAKGLAGPAEQASLHEAALQPTRPAALTAFAAEKPGLGRENSTARTVPEYGENPASVGTLKASVSLNDLLPARPVAKQKERGIRLDSMVCPPDSAAQLLAEMKRNLGVASPIPQLMPPKGGNGSSSAAKGSQLSASEKRTLTLDTMDQLSGNHRLERPLGNSFPTRHFLARMVASLAVLQRIRPSIILVQVLLRHWMFDFKRDWFSMINATALPEMKKSLLRWLRQPFHSNLWRQPRASRLAARRSLHQ